MKNKTIRNNSNRNVNSNNCKDGFTGFEDKIEKVFKENNMDITSTSFNLERQIVHQLKQAVNPSNIKPYNDFYSYVNERWLKNLDIEVYQEYIVEIDDFRLVQDKVYRELIPIIEKYLKTNKTEKARRMKNAYESFKSFNTDAQTKQFTSKIVTEIDALRENKSNVWEILGKINLNEIISWGAPFVWSINPDDKNPKKYKCYLEPPEVTLLDVDIYFDYKYDTKDDKEYKEKYRREYFRYLEDLFKLAFGSDHGFNIHDVYNVEIQLLNAMSCDLIKQSDEDIDRYNLISKEEAIEKFGFDWEHFCKALGFKTVPHEFVTSNVNNLLCGTKLLLEKWDSDEWRTYWIYLYIRQQTRWNREGFKLYYNFYGKFLRGQQREIDNYIRPIFGMSFCFNTFLTNEYVSHYKNQRAIDYVKSMVNDLRIVFSRIIKRNKWMEPKTKKTAIEKLEAIKLIIGSPEKLREDPLIKYESDDPWGNLVKMALWRHYKAIELTGKDVVDIPVIDWSTIPPKLISTQAYVVNAMYTPTENSIYIPLGYIQKPFVDLEERGLEYNLAHIGFTIAHEMSHSLDDLGSQYDKNGVLSNWWTKKDSENFAKIQKDIVKQYEDYAKQDGIIFDAWPSIGEDMADISGFSICLEYLRDFQLKNKYILPVQSLSFETFFVYFALQSRQKISKKSVLAQLKTNPHPLDKYRCNIPLSRSEVFRAIYKVKKGDKMWWHTTNSVWT